MYTTGLEHYKWLKKAKKAKKAKPNNSKLIFLPKTAFEFQSCLYDTLLQSWFWLTCSTIFKSYAIALAQSLFELPQNFFIPVLSEPHHLQSHQHVTKNIMLAEMRIQTFWKAESL